MKFFCGGFDSGSGHLIFLSEGQIIEYGILAQLVEHLTFNQVVRGSNPRCLMNLRYYRYDSTFFVGV